MGEKKDSGSKDADNFGAEFGTDQSAAQRQAAMRRNQAAQRSRSRAGDDRASGRPTPVPVVAPPSSDAGRDFGPRKSGSSTRQNITRTTLPDGRVVLTVDGIPRILGPNDPLARDRSVVDNTDPTGGRLANATLTAVSNTQTETDSDFDSIPYMGGTSFREDLMREAANITDRDTRNFGAEFGGINPITADVSPVLALTRNAMNQGSGIASLQDQGIAPDAAIDEVFLPPASGTTTPASPEPDLGFEDVDDDDSFFPVTNQRQDITALNPNFLSRLPLVGDALYQGQINQLQQFASIPGSKYDYSTGGGSAQVGQGTLTLSPSGIVTYDGPKDASYTGPFANLVNPTERPEKDAGDPCPPGFQLIGGVCQPMFDVAGPATPPTPGSNFQMAPTSGFPTSFAPMTQATPVSLPDPFVLSPTGAAVGRRL